MKKKILLIGGGGHCKSVIDVIEQENRFEIAGIIDKKELIGHDVLGYKIVGSDEDLNHLRQHYHYAFITVGQINSPEIRIELFEMLKCLGYELPVVISPLAYVSKHGHISEGSIVMHHALVNASAHIGKNCIINTKALVEHDAIIEDHCHISTGAILNGGAHVKAGTFYGSNVTCKEYATVKGFIKAGSIVK
ncbi:NeuD/PglB/VioB family sugar acetyltransferase [Sulfurospirillum sp. UCH001]|uniref:NeuD/PglB/VioB family sugar acetyltransferase n=1 Tax=Sulfurospirillum sp. UCH001 TaxID=1581011 RepID=UPI00082FE5AF|nr:NeuD/PglB/VioB family sugar acetyltransferase [Sulfurospirillum sp. UCH001]